MQSLLFISVGMVCLTVAGMLLTRHADVIEEVRDVSIPLVVEVPRLERRLEVIREQAELGELHSIMRIGSPEERIHVFSLPKEPDIDRLMALFDVARDILIIRGQLSEMSPIEFGEQRELDEETYAQPLSVSFSVHEEGMRTILTLMELAGLLTVGDALTSEELDILLERTESESATGVLPLEKFLSTDLLDYARNPRLYEERLQKSFSSSSFMEAFRSIIQSSLLRDAKIILSSDIGKNIEKLKLWPIQFVTIEDVQIQSGSAPGWNWLRLELLVYGRS